MILHLYLAFVRLHLEYLSCSGSQIEKDIDALEQVWWSASKTMWELGNMTYKERLRELGFLCQMREGYECFTTVYYSLRQVVEKMKPHCSSIHVEKMTGKGHKF